MGIDTKKMTDKPDSGFSLIEVLIAVAIFAIGFLAVGAMQINGLTTTTSSRRSTEAMTIAERQAEALMAMTFYDQDADLDGVGGVERYDMLPDLAAGNHNDGGAAWAGDYSVFWTVVDDTPLIRIPDGIYTTAGFGGLTRSKAITLWVTTDNNLNERLLTLQFVKVWALDNEW